MSLNSPALPVEMQVCLSIVADHLECRCGFVFDPAASFEQCLDHARKCHGEATQPKPTAAGPAPDNAREALEEFKRMERMARAGRFQKTWGGWRNGGWYERLRSLRPEARESRNACGECGGTGEIVNDGPHSVCDDCNGTGREIAGRAE